MEQTLISIVEIVLAAGGNNHDVGRLTWFVMDNEHIAKQKEVGWAYRRVIGKHFPAMSMAIIKDLVEDDALLEIEATAYLLQSN